MKADQGEVVVTTMYGLWPRVPAEGCLRLSVVADWPQATPHERAVAFWWLARMANAHRHPPGAFVIEGVVFRDGETATPLHGFVARKWGLVK